MKFKSKAKRYNFSPNSRFDQIKEDRIFLAQNPRAKHAVLPVLEVNNCQNKSGSGLNVAQKITALTKSHIKSTYDQGLPNSAL